MLVPPEVMNLTKCADTESSRYALGGIRFERDEEGVAHAISTDGRRLVHVTWNEDAAEEYPAVGVSPERVNGFETILSVEDCKEAQKLPPKKTFKTILENVLLSEPGANGEVMYAATDLRKHRVITTKSLEGRYPRWKEAIPKYKELTEKNVKTIHAVYGKDCSRLAAVIKVNAKFLAELCDTLLKAAVDDVTEAIDLIVPLDGEGAMHIKRRGEKAKAEAVLMPLARG